MNKNMINYKNFFMYFNTIALVITVYTLLSTLERTFFFSTINALNTFSIFLYISTFMSITLLVIVAAINHNANTKIKDDNNDGKLTKEDEDRLQYMIKNSFSRLMVTITFNIILIMLIGELSKNYFVDYMSFLNLKGEIIFTITTFMFFLWFLPYYDIGKSLFMPKQEE